MIQVEKDRYICTSCIQIAVLYLKEAVVSEFLGPFLAFDFPLVQLLQKSSGLIMLDGLSLAGYTDL
jgi:hypothetical protein